MLLALACGERRDAERGPDRFAAPPARPLDAVEEARVYEALESGSDALPALLDDVVARGDHRFVGVLIEGLRASALRLVPETHHNARVVALERLSGEALGADWFAWTSWYQRTSLRAPPGFHGLKARLLARLDPTLAGLFATPATDGARIEEIVYGGAPPDRDDGGPDPAHVAAADAELAAGDPVVGVVVGGEARAYPLRWLDWHEIANDRLGGRDVAVVWCGFVGSAMAFERLPASRLAPSGLVQRSVRLMVDRASGTLWNELTGRRASGGRGGARVAGDRLQPLPAVLTTWSAWRGRHPDTTALLGGRESSGPALTPYAGYHTTDEAVFPVALERAELPAKARVYGVERGLHARAWELGALLEAGVVNGEVGGAPVVLVARRGAIELEGEHPRRGRLRFSPGAEVRGYLRERAVELAPGERADELVDAGGGVWRVGDEALVGPGGARGDRIPGTVAYWFAWQAFYPETELVRAE
ncbi:MAG TPA: DUF3179 domain-containing (seleno)protein [Myxococcota bacterium]|nr:DUF3179 domain-containing (seleno)protein [Myxococcota bacterium]